MRKYMMSFALAFILLCTNFMNINAAESATVYTTGVVSEAGKTVEVDIGIRNCEGFANLGLEIDYDSEIFTLISAENNPEVGAVFVPSQDESVKPYVLTWNSVSNTQYNGVLVTLTFQISDAAPEGEHEISISFQKGNGGNYVDGINVNYDENFAPLNLSYTSGKVLIQYPQNEITVSDVHLEDVQGTINASGNVSLNGKNTQAGHILIGGYKDNRLLTLKTYVADDSIDFMLLSNDKPDCIQVFWWDSMGSLRPLAKSKIIEIP